MYIYRRANEEVHSEFSMEEDIADKQKQWISVALRTDSDSTSVSKQSGKSYDVLDYGYALLCSFCSFIRRHKWSQKTQSDKKSKNVTWKLLQKLLM